MQKNTLTLARELIAIESTEHKPDQLSAALNRALREVREYTIERFERKGVQSALVFYGKERPEKFKVLLNAHLDVVPGKPEQFRPVVRVGKLYGMGALDMKANAACLIHLFKELARSTGYPLGLQLVTDEEIGGFNGTKYQVEQGVAAEFVIAGEATNLDIVNRAKGIVRLKISAPGETAHGAYPWRGKNAILAMNRFLQQLTDRFPAPVKEGWVTTINVARIETNNQALNKIPDDCTVWLDVRHIPKDSTTIIDAITALTPADFVVQVLANEPSVFIDESDPYIETLQRVGKATKGKPLTCYGANGASDARHFVAAGGSGVEFGAGGGGIGSDTEWISLTSLEQYYAILQIFLTALR